MNSNNNNPNANKLPPKNRAVRRGGGDDSDEEDEERQRRLDQARIDAYMVQRAGHGRGAQHVSGAAAGPSGTYGGGAQRGRGAARGSGIVPTSSVATLIRRGAAEDNATGTSSTTSEWSDDGDDDDSDSLSDQHDALPDMEWLFKSPPQGRNSLPKVSPPELATRRNANTRHYDSSRARMYYYAALRRLAQGRPGYAYTGWTRFWKHCTSEERDRFMPGTKLDSHEECAKAIIDKYKGAKKFSYRAPARHMQGRNTRGFDIKHVPKKARGRPPREQLKISFLEGGYVKVKRPRGRPRKKVAAAPAGAANAEQQQEVPVSPMQQQDPTQTPAAGALQTGPNAAQQQRTPSPVRLDETGTPAAGALQTGPNAAQQQRTPSPVRLDETGTPAAGAVQPGPNAEQQQRTQEVPVSPLQQQDPMQAGEANAEEQQEVPVSPLQQQDPTQTPAAGALHGVTVGVTAQQQQDVGARTPAPTPRRNSNAEEQQEVPVSPLQQQDATQTPAAGALQTGVTVGVTAQQQQDVGARTPAPTPRRNSMADALQLAQDFLRHFNPSVREQAKIDAAEKRARQNPPKRKR